MLKYLRDQTSIQLHLKLYEENLMMGTEVFIGMQYNHNRKAGEECSVLHQSIRTPKPLISVLQSDTSTCYRFYLNSLLILAYTMLH